MDGPFLLSKAFLYAAKLNTQCLGTLGCELLLVPPCVDFLWLIAGCEPPTFVDFLCMLECFALPAWLAPACDLPCYVKIVTYKISCYRNQELMVKQ